MAALEFSSWSDSAGQFLGRVAASSWAPIVVNLAALVLLIAGIALWTWRIFEPPAGNAAYVTLPAPVPGALDLQPLISANVFGSADTPAGTVDPNQLPVSSLNIVLTGIMAKDKDGQVMVSVNGGPQTAVSVGQEILPGTALHAIYADRIVISRGAALEMVMLKDSDAKLPPGSIVGGQFTGNPPHMARSRAPRSGQGQNSNSMVNPIQPTGRGSYNIDREALQQQVTPEVLSQATVTPGSNGLVVRHIQSGSMFEKIGLRVGDVVRSINGQPVKTLDDVFRIYAQVAAGGQSQVAVELTRGGQTEVLEYQLQ